MPELNLMDRYPATPRRLDERARLVTDAHRAVARRFDREFFDGERLVGYGGYRYHPRFWTETVERLRAHYGLAEDAAVLDVGCAKGFMLYDWRRLHPRTRVAGLDVSRYAVSQAPPEVAPHLVVGDARALPYPDRSFDLVVSINTVHNLPLAECRQALREIQRVGRGHAFVVVDAWRNDDERRRMLQWNLTALTYMHADDWTRLFGDVGYRGDWWWFIAG